MEKEKASSIATTPTWAVAAVCSAIVVAALLMEHAIHLLNALLRRRKRRTLNQALNHMQAELRSFGFMSLLLGVAEQPISKICIPLSLGDSFLPCRSVDLSELSGDTCKDKGKVSLLSARGTDQLLLLIVMLAASHVLTCLATFALAMTKVGRWSSWEEETRTIDYQLSNDPRRYTLACQTSFGKRHLKFWSDHRLLTWLVCCLRHVADSVSKADYFALRHSFINVHLGRNVEFDFHKLLRRSLDHDFVVVAGISHWSWTYAILFIFFNAQGFYSYLWVPFIPFLMLLAVGTKLEAAITRMCSDSSMQAATVLPGSFCVKPDSKYFWFGRQDWLLHAIHFILFQNSFQVAFFVWTWYNFGFPSCFHTRREDIILSVAVGGAVQCLCAYNTLPLYVLVTQMDSTLKEAVFADPVMEGLRNWRKAARKSLAAAGKSSPTTESVRTRRTDDPGTLLGSPKASDETLVLPGAPPADTSESGRREESAGGEGAENEMMGSASGRNHVAYDGEVSFGLWERGNPGEMLTAETGNSHSTSRESFRSLKAGSGLFFSAPIAETAECEDGGDVGVEAAEIEEIPGTDVLSTAASDGEV